MQQSLQQGNVQGNSGSNDRGDGSYPKLSFWGQLCKPKCSVFFAASETASLDKSGSMILGSMEYSRTFTSSFRYWIDGGSVAELRIIGVAFKMPI